MPGMARLMFCRLCQKRYAKGNVVVATSTSSPGATIARANRRSGPSASASLCAAVYSAATPAPVPMESAPAHDALDLGLRIVQRRLGLGLPHQRRLHDLGHRLAD